MATVGEILKQKRQEQNLTLHDVSEVTTISSNFLDAIENNAFKKLPRGVFPKMFIRSYARHLGLDDDPLIQMYYSQVAEVESPAQPSPAESRPTSSRRRGGHWTRILVAVVVVGALLGVVYVIYQHGESSLPLGDTAPADAPGRPAASALSPPVATDVPATEVAAAAAPDDATPPSAVPALPPPDEPPATGVFDPQSVLLAIQAHAVCWVRIINEGAAQDFILQPGETFQYRYVKPVVLQIGNAGGVTLLLNGRKSRALGTTGQVVELNVSPANWRDFLAVPEEN